MTVRSLFRERHSGIGLLRFFPEAARALDGFPTVAEVATVETGPVVDHLDLLVLKIVGAA